MTRGFSFELSSRLAGSRVPGIGNVNSRRQHVPTTPDCVKRDMSCPKSNSTCPQYRERKRKNCYLVCIQQRFSSLYANGKVGFSTIFSSTSVFQSLAAFPDESEALLRARQVRDALWPKPDAVAAFGGGLFLQQQGFVVPLARPPGPGLQRASTNLFDPQAERLAL